MFSNVNIMTLKDLKISATTLYETATALKEKGMDVSKIRSDFYDFKQKKKQYYLTVLNNTSNKVIKLANSMRTKVEDESVVSKIAALSEDFQANYADNDKLIAISDNILSLVAEVKMKKGIMDDVPQLPEEIRKDVEADILEIDRCFKMGAYRSVTILCGRILEVCLHRKYFDVTGRDILEKNPGIGLGNLVGKLNEKEVDFDPGIKEQIHLINQVRIFSVHKKKEPFYPTKSQAQAMILYVTDVLKKIY